MSVKLYRYEGYVSGDRLPSGAIPVRFALGFDVFVEKDLMISQENLECNKSYTFDTSQPRDVNGNYWQAEIVETPWHKMHRYKCMVERVYDGDTITRAVVDLGFNTTIIAKFRLYGINAPELKGKTLEAARRSRDRLIGLVLDKEVLIETRSDQKEKYGRHLATVIVDGINVNHLLVDEGFAVPYMV